MKKRQVNKTILVQCEGLTEKHYISELKRSEEFRNITIRPGIDGRTDPIGVVDAAIRNYEENSYDRVFVLIDADKSELVGKAKRKLESYIKNKRVEQGVFQIILSSPCFEFWKLIHFACYRKCFVNYDECEKELSKQIKQKYEKTEAHFDKYKFYKTHKAEQPQAVNNSKAIRETIKRDSCDYSFTEIDILIEALNGLCDKK